MSLPTWDMPHEHGAIIRHFSVESKILKESARGGFDHVRPHVAYIPREALSGQKLPSVYLLAPWTGAGRSMFNWEPFREDLPSRLSRLISNKVIPPCVVICPDLYISYGGSQYINSSWTGNHGDHIVHELIPYVETHFQVLPGARHRAVLGRSSGGFGAIRFAMDYEDAFAAVACHAGDIGFEWCYRRNLIDICTGLTKFQDPLIWMKEIEKQKKLSGFDTHILMMLGMCAFYSPNPSKPVGFDMPINIRDGAVDEEVWTKWVSQDPLHLASSQKVQDRLGRLRHLFIDCGNRDQYFLQYGSRQLSERLKKSGVAHHYGEFDDNHSGTAYRYDESLPRLLSVLQ